MINSLTLGYPRLKGLVSANNHFSKDNMGAVTVDKAFKVTVDFSKLVCSSGNLKVPKVAVSFKKEESKFVFTQTVQQQTLTSNPEDVAYVVVYEKVQHEAEAYKLNTREVGGVVEEELPEDWVIDNCEFYMFALNQGRTQASRTSYLQLTTV